MKKPPGVQRCRSTGSLGSNSMFIREVCHAIGIIALAAWSVPAWWWAFYGHHAAAQWWRREYLWTALSVPIVAGIVLSFRTAVRAEPATRASLRVGLMLITCAGIVPLAGLLGLWAITSGGPIK